MMWIGIYLLIGVVVATLLVVRGMPRDVRAVDILAIPFLVVFWPAMVFFIVADVRLLDEQQRSFTMGKKDNDNQD